MEKHKSLITIVGQDLEHQELYTVGGNINSYTLFGNIAVLSSIVKAHIPLASAIPLLGTCLKEMCAPRVIVHNPKLGISQIDIIGRMDN